MTSTQKRKQIHDDRNKVKEHRNEKEREREQHAGDVWYLFNSWIFFCKSVHLNGGRFVSRLEN